MAWYARRLARHQVKKDSEGQIRITSPAFTLSKKNGETGASVTLWESALSDSDKVDHYLRECGTMPNGKVRGLCFVSEADLEKMRSDWNEMVTAIPTPNDICSYGPLHHDLTPEMNFPEKLADFASSNGHIKLPSDFYD